MATRVSAPHLCLQILGLNRSLQQPLRPLISPPYIVFSIRQFPPKLGPHLPSRLMKMGFYWSGSPASKFIKDMRGPGGWGGVVLQLYLPCRQRKGFAHSRANCFQIEHSCRQPGAWLFRGTVWEKVASPPRSRFVRLKGFWASAQPQKSESAD